MTKLGQGIRGHTTLSTQEARSVTKSEGGGVVRPVRYKNIFWVKIISAEIKLAKSQCLKRNLNTINYFIGSFKMFYLGKIYYIF